MAWTTPGTATAGEVLTAAFWNEQVRDNLAQLGTGYTFVETVYFTSSGSFTKASYPYLRAIRVRVQAGGGAGGGVPATGSGSFASSAGGGGGGYAESFVTDISSLSASETVTVGAGGTGASNATGGTGGTSSFGSIASASGGVGGDTSTGNGTPGVGTVGDLLISGTAGLMGSGSSTLNRYGTLVAPSGNGGPSFLGGGSRGGANGVGLSAGVTGGNYGGGGSGCTSGSGNNAAAAGGNGAPGIVIVELFA